MNSKTQRQLERFKRAKKTTARKMDAAMKANRWREGRNHHFWFHHLGDQIRKLKEENKQ